MQKRVQKKKKEGQLIDIQHIPEEWITLFLKTSQRDYDRMKIKGDLKSTAKIDLIKVLLGANYLGKAQISYIQTMVQKAILQYSFNRLPSIIVFDDIQVAVAMNLDEKDTGLRKLFTGMLMS
ncbi:MAG: hypothetical protein HC905_14700 [Bacteroidales bacterium]|nr:hypothetical protein [Bacteroidales bacterium]